MSQSQAKFLDGDLMRHIVVMSLSASIGLVSMFLVDFVDLYFVSILGEMQQAAIGYAATLLYVTFSINIGLMIAAGALAARRIGQGDVEGARTIITSVLVIGLAISVVVGGLVFAFAPYFVTLVGAAGDTAAAATSYMRIVVLGMPFAAVGLIGSGLLRAHGDARRAMMATLVAGGVNAVLDPIFIFGFGWGLEGAACASVAARFATLLAAIIPIFRVYGGLAPVRWPSVSADIPLISAIALPAILTNVATPFGIIIVTRVISTFGDSAVAGFAVTSRVIPLIFCVIFALSGAVGPIIGQNFGASFYSRVRSTLFKSLQFISIYTVLAWALLFVLNGVISDQFSLSDEGRNLVFWYALIVAPLFLFNGMLFISNAAFNNLNRPIYSTALNWLKNSLGVIPFVYFGALWGGAPGVLIGQGVGGIAFGLIGFWMALRLVDKYQREAEAQTA